MNQNEIFLNTSEKVWYFNCPWCKQQIAVEDSEVRCTIFRHAVFKENMSFVPPHASETECQRWLKEDLVWGCAKPFIFDRKTVKKCGYI